uniref:Uncharacterized protein n=1 Tax=Solanum tuberosum TaxID=4113 RepID=M1BJ44_SOLTU
MWLTHRRQKVATSLMKSCEELTKKEGYKFIVLQVLGKLASKKFIHQNGLLSCKRQRRDDTSHERDFTPIVPRPKT